MADRSRLRPGTPDFSQLGILRPMSRYEITRQSRGERSNPTSRRQFGLRDTSVCHHVHSSTNPVKTALIKATDIEASRHSDPNVDRRIANLPKPKGRISISYVGEPSEIAQERRRTIDNPIRAYVFEPRTHPSLVPTRAIFTLCVGLLFLFGAILAGLESIWLICIVLVLAGIGLFGTALGILRDLSSSRSILSS
jgi:hypothetical protein